MKPGELEKKFAKIEDERDGDAQAPLESNTTKPKKTGRLRLCGLRCGRRSVRLRGVAEFERECGSFGVSKRHAKAADHG